MLNSHYIETLLGIKDVLISNIEKNDQDLTLHIWFSLQRKPHPCPSCCHLTDKIHDYSVFMNPIPLFQDIIV